MYQRKEKKNNNQQRSHKTRRNIYC